MAPEQKQTEMLGLDHASTYIDLRDRNVNDATNNN